MSPALRVFLSEDTMRGLRIGRLRLRVLAGLEAAAIRRGVRCPARLARLRQLREGHTDLIRVERAMPAILREMF